MQARTHEVLVVLFAGPRCAHGVRLASAGLAIGEEGDIVTARKCRDGVGEVVPDALLGNIGTKDAIEDEELATLGRVDGDARVGGGLDHGSLEALGDEVVAGIGWLERRTNTDG